MNVPDPVGPIINIFFGMTSARISAGKRCRRQRFRSATATHFLASLWPMIYRSSSLTSRLGLRSSRRWLIDEWLVECVESAGWAAVCWWRWSEILMDCLIVRLIDRLKLDIEVGLIDEVIIWSIEWLFETARNPLNRDVIGYSINQSLIVNGYEEQNDQSINQSSAKHSFWSPNRSIKANSP